MPRQQITEITIKLEGNSLFYRVSGSPPVQAEENWKVILLDLLTKWIDQQKAEPPTGDCIKKLEAYDNQPVNFCSLQPDFVIAVSPFGLGEVEYFTVAQAESMTGKTPKQLEPKPGIGGGIAIYKSKLVNVYDDNGKLVEKRWVPAGLFYDDFRS